MRWRHHGEPRVGSAIAPIVNIQPFGIDTDTHRSYPGKEQATVSGIVSGVFYPDAIAHIGQCQCCDRNPRLRTRRDDDLVRIADNATRGAQILCQGLA